MNDSARRESGHLMLITPERVFYAGLLGRPRQRCPGAFHVYVSIEAGLWLTTADGRESYGELAVVPPNVRHTIASDYRSAICLVIEPESVRAGAFEATGGAAFGSRRTVLCATHPRRLCRVAAAASAATTSATPSSTPCASARRCRRVRSIRASSNRLRRSAGSAAIR